LSREKKKTFTLRRCKYDIRYAAGEVVESDMLEDCIIKKKRSISRVKGLDLGKCKN
jgi:hypothetical protein